MFTRLKRTALSFFTVVAAFLVYRLIAEPLIEPSVEPIKRVARVSPEELKGVRDRAAANRLGGYARFFEPGSWELDNPIILESDTSKVLLKEYVTQPDGRVSVNPCTVIYLPDGDAEASDSRKRVVILRNPQGAVLQFEGDVDLSRGKLGKLLGGKLNGPITIQSAATKSDGSDDLLVTTHDVEMKDNRIFTPNEVDFRFGSSYGHGRNMLIDLIPGPDKGSKSRGPSIGGLQSFELTNDVQMHLQPGSSGFMLGDRKGAEQAAGARAAPGMTPGAQPQQPVDIRCQGPFQFDLVAYIASFHDAVDVRRPNPLGGPGDQMNSELLSIFFAPRDSGGPSGSDPQSSTKKSAGGSQPMPQLEPRRFVAEGNPVIVHAPSRSVDAVGQRLEYDISTGRIALKSTDEVQLHQESNEAHGKSFVYEPGPNNAWLGYLDSDGPGWLTAASRENPSQQFQARWSKKLTMLPQDQNHVISLVGDAWASYAERGQIAAEEIHVWLYEIPPAQRVAAPRQRQRSGDATGGTSDALRWIQPVKMYADGDVRIDSPQLSGAVKRMNAWFRDPTAAAATSGGASSAGNVTQPSPPGAGRGPGGRSPLAQRDPSAPQSHYEIKRAGLLEAWLTSGQQAQLEHVTMKDNVDFIQTPPANVAEPPLEVVGDEVQVLHAPDAEVTVQGHPAQVAAQGLGMFGTEIKLDRVANRLWINGPGRMTWEGNRHLQANQNGAAPSPIDGLSSDGPMDIDWREKMQFDGKTALFAGDVVSHRVGNRIEADGRRSQLTQTIRTPALEVTLHERVDFAEMRSTNQPAERRQMEQMKCHGEVQLENRELIDGHPAALEQMQIRDLIVNGMTGETTSQGPGRLYSWRLGSPSAMLAPPGGQTAAGPPRSSNNQVSAIPVGSTTAGRSKPNESQINYLDVQFQNGIRGNMLGRRTLTFLDQVRSIYGPVAAWDAKLDPDDPHGLPPQSMLMTCDQLTVSEGPEQVKGIRAPMELEATGNTRTDGQQATGEMFTTQAARLSYSEAKGMLILQGDGRSEAQLFRQARPGAAPEQGRFDEIHYWPATGKTEIPRARSITASQLITPRSERPAAPPKPGTGFAH